MLKIMILICSASLDYRACTPDTATDVVRAMRVSSIQQCGFMGQAMLAPTALAPAPDSRQFQKIMCVPDGPIDVVSAGMGG